jgi:N-acetyl-alpha-D-muramate 1-phosphate uridylyltransferase
MKAMIFAAGLGTRLKPWTDRHPKALAMVNGKSLLQRNIEYLQKFGIEEVIVNVHHFADQIIEAIYKNKGWGSRVSISDESALVLETGGGLKKASWYFDNDSFLIMNADILTDLDLYPMFGYHNNNNALATLAVTNRVTSRYFLFTEGMDLCGWRNTRTGEEKGPVLHFPAEQKQLVQQMAFSGIHLVQTRIFSLMKKDGSFSIVDLYLELAQNEKIKGFEHNHSILVDVGKPESLSRAAILFP